MTEAEDLQINLPIVRVWALGVTSVLCVLFAHPISRTMTSTSLGGGAYSVDSGAASVWVLTIYLLGGMSFVWAIVERISLEIAGLKEERQK